MSYLTPAEARHELRLGRLNNALIAVTRWHAAHVGQSEYDAALHNGILYSAEFIRDVARCRCCLPTLAAAQALAQED